MRANKVLMIRPVSFGFNHETAASNTFQIETVVDQEAIQKEFDDSVAELRKFGIHVDVIEDTKSPIKPDSIFPNNWIQMRSDGALVVFPMLTENRRVERRLDILDFLIANYRVKQVVDMSGEELKGRILEGTGSVVFDHYLNKSLKPPATFFLSLFPY